MLCASQKNKAPQGRIYTESTSVSEKESAEQHKQCDLICSSVPTPARAPAPELTWAYNHLYLHPYLCRHLYLHLYLPLHLYLCICTCNHLHLYLCLHLHLHLYLSCGCTYTCACTYLSLAWAEVSCGDFTGEECTEGSMGRGP